MEIFNQLKALADKVEKLKDQIDTEESTKHAFVLPFIHILGYDTFNPTEVLPEFTADLGMKKGEKVDYAIFQNGNPILIIECKHWKNDLNVHNSSQLFRYFHTTKTRFALLTNGITFKFYTDLESTNKMDEKPFLEFNLTKLKESTAREVEKFHKSKFNVETIIDSASSLKYVKEIKKVIDAEIHNPSVDFVKYFANQVYSGRMTSSVVSEFTEMVKRAFNQFISDKVSDRLSFALSKEEEIQEVEKLETEIVSDPDIITTDEELEGYNIVLAIARRVTDKSRIVHRDTKSYFGVLFDDNNRKPICRLHLNGGVKYMSLFDENKTTTRVDIDSVDDIYKYEKQILDTVKRYATD